MSAWLQVVLALACVCLGVLGTLLFRRSRDRGRVKTDVRDVVSGWVEVEEADIMQQPKSELVAEIESRFGTEDEGTL